MKLFPVDTSVTAASVAKEHGAKWLRSPRAGWWLALIAFAESVIAPIIIDPFLMAMIMANPKRWRFFTVVSIIASLAGGVVGYILGALFFETIGAPILQFYGLMDGFARVSEGVNAGAFAFVFIGAFTPIPYKLIAISAGVVQLPFVTFLVASIVGRVLRLGLVGIATHAVGPRALPVVRRYLHHIAAVVAVVLIGYFIYQYLT